MSGRRVFGVDMSVLRFQDQPGKSKPDAGAVFRCVFSAVESVKQMGKILFGEAAAAILYKNLSIRRIKALSRSNTDRTRSILRFL